MNRRSLLAITASSGASVLAGCLSDDGATDPGNGSAEGTGGGTTYDPTAVTLGVEASATGSRSGTVAFEGSVARRATDEQPPALRLDLRNEGDEAVDVAVPEPFPWRQYANRGNDDAEFHLIPHDTGNLTTGMGEAPPAEWVPAEPTDGCWQANSETRPGWPDVGYPTVTLDPDEAVGGEFVVLTSQAVEECFPEGEYPFPDDEARVETDDGSEQVSLELTLVVGESE